MELVINNETYYIPNKWNEVSLGCYMRFMEAYNEEDTDLQKEIVLLSSFTGAPIEKLGNIKKKMLDQAVEHLAKLMDTKVTEDVNLIIEIDDVEYGLHPDLHNLKLKEFVDLDNKLAEGWENMHAVMSILYRPVETVNAAAAFFLAIGIDYTKITQVYSKLNRKTRRKLTKQKKNYLTKGTAGTL